MRVPILAWMIVVAALGGPGAALAQGTPDEMPLAGQPCDPDRCRLAPAKPAFNACISELAREEDRALNRLYAAVRARLPTDASRALQVAQRNWVAYRTSLDAFGLAYSPNPAESYLMSCQATSDRTIALLRLLDDLDQKATSQAQTPTPSR